MIRNGMLFIFAVLTLQAGAQLSLTTTYTFLKAPVLDDMVRAYNFARPWQENDQPFLSSGYGGSIGYYFQLKRRQSLYLHPIVSYNRFASNAENENTSLSIALHQFSAQADIHFNPRALFHDVAAGPIGTRFFITVSPGFTLWKPALERNEEEVMYDEEERYSPPSYSWFAEVGTGYRSLLLGNSWAVTPFARARYIHSIEIPDFHEYAFGANATQRSTESLNNWQFQVGVEWTFLFRKK
jgi:hypothetical protein